MDATHALGGSIVVSWRGHRLTLAINPADGTTEIVKDQKSHYDRVPTKTIRSAGYTDEDEECFS
jgi:hypothetical protein